MYHLKLKTHIHGPKIHRHSTNRLPQKQRPRTAITVFVSDCNIQVSADLSV